MTLSPPFSPLILFSFGSSPHSPVQILFSPIDIWIIVCLRAPSGSASQCLPTHKHIVTHKQLHPDDVQDPPFTWASELCSSERWQLHSPVPPVFTAEALQSTTSPRPEWHLLLSFFLFCHCLPAAHRCQFLTIHIQSVSLSGLFSPSYSSCLRPCLRCFCPRPLPCLPVDSPPCSYATPSDSCRLFIKWLCIHLIVLLWPHMTP